MCQQTASKHRCCYDIYRWRSNEQDDQDEVTQAVEYARSYVVNSRIAEGAKKKTRYRISVSQVAKQRSNLRS